MSFELFTTTYSLNVNSTLVFDTGTKTELGVGDTLTSTGGMVSFGPPEGPVVVFAQECENMMLPNISPTGIAGKQADMIFFILFI